MRTLFESLGLLSYQSGRSGGCKSSPFDPMDSMLRQMQMQANAAAQQTSAGGYQQYQNALAQYAQQQYRPGDIMNALHGASVSAGFPEIVKPPLTERQVAIKELKDYLGFDLWCQIDRPTLAAHGLLADE